MKNIRLYQNKVFKVGSEAVLDKDAQHHLLKVLRFPIGSMITLFNGDSFLLAKFYANLMRPVISCSSSYCNNAFKVLILK